MLKKWMIAVAFVALGCGDDGDDPSSGDPGGKTQKDASAPKDAAGQGSSDASRHDASKPQEVATDDAGSMSPPDMMSEPDSGTVPSFPDGGTFVHGSGSCCEAHDAPGCGNADLEVCVCELNKACCTGAWTLDCALIVKQRYCQAGVRECVLDTWKQEACRLNWTDICELTGEKKCGLVPGCF